MTKLKRVEMKLRRAIEAALEEGWLIATGSIGGVSAGGVLQCCALGAVARNHLHSHGYPAYEYADRVLGITGQESMSIIRGFDSESSGDKYRELGARLRRDYYETTAEVVK